MTPTAENALSKLGAMAIATDGKAIVPHDTNAIPTNSGKPILGIYVGSGGTITMRGIGGTADFTITAGTGSFLPIRPTHIRATGTGASNLVAMY